MYTHAYFTESYEKNSEFLAILLHSDFFSQTLIISCLIQKVGGWRFLAVFSWYLEVLQSTWQFKEKCVQGCIL